MFMLIVLCASWGLQQVTIKIANEGVSPILQSSVRSIGASILVWVWMVIRREAIFERDGTLWWGIVAGLLFSVEFVLIYWGLCFTNASRAVIFLNTMPFSVALGAHWLIPGERMHKVQVMGLICAFAGIVIAFSESLRLPSYSMFIGDCMLAIAAVLWGATTVLIKASPLAKISPRKTLLYHLAVSAFIMPLGSLAVGEAGIVLMTPLIALCLAYQVIWVASITYIAWIWLIGRYPASRLASFTFLTPLFGVLAGGLLLDEPMTPALIIALALVSMGIYLVNRSTTN